MIILIILLDQLIKYFMYANKPNQILIKDFLEIIYSENTGTVFGTFQNTNAIFATISLIVIIALIIAIKKCKFSSEKMSVLLKIILAGGISNLIDRVFRGFVVDYLYIKPFGICNLADICISISVVLMIIFEIIKDMKESEKNDNR